MDGYGYHFFKLSWIYGYPSRQILSYYIVDMELKYVNWLFGYCERENVNNFVKSLRHHDAVDYWKFSRWRVSIWQKFSWIHWAGVLLQFSIRYFNANLIMILISDNVWTKITWNWQLQINFTITLISRNIFLVWCKLMQTVKIFCPTV